MPTMRRFAASLLMAGAAHAAPPGELQGAQLLIENDVFAVGNADRWYTNGIRASWSWDKAATTSAARLLRELARWGMQGYGAPTLTYTIGQTMYTPRDITVSTAQPYDRPWGAFLFGGATAHAYDGRWFAASELKLGTTGHAAGGRWAQATVHAELSHSAPPAGWKQQLKTRPGIQMSHARVLRLGDNEDGNDFVGVQGAGSVAIGTLRSYAQLSGAVFFGDLESGHTPMPIPNEGDFVVQDFENRGQFRKFFGFVAVGVNAVAYNYFLQGRTPYGRPQIDKKDWVGVLHFGLSVPLDRWALRRLDGRFARSVPRVLFTQTIRTPEFSSRDPRWASSRSRFGAIQLVWDFKD